MNKHPEHVPERIHAAGHACCSVCWLGITQRKRKSAYMGTRSKCGQSKSGTWSGRTGCDNCLARQSLSSAMWSLWESKRHIPRPHTGDGSTIIKAFVHCPSLGLQWLKLGRPQMSAHGHAISRGNTRWRLGTMVGSVSWLSYGTSTCIHWALWEILDCKPDEGNVEVHTSG